MDSDKAVAANLELVTYTLSLNAAACGQRNIPRVAVH
jgi:hypothetical protein